MLKTLLLNHIALSDIHLIKGEECIAAQRLRVSTAAYRDRNRATARLKIFIGIQEQAEIRHKLLIEALNIYILLKKAKDGSPGHDEAGAMPGDRSN